MRTDYMCYILVQFILENFYLHFSDKKYNTKISVLEMMFCVFPFFSTYFYILHVSVPYTEYNLMHITTHKQT